MDYIPKELQLIIVSYVRNVKTLIVMSDTLNLKNIDYFSLLQIEYSHLFINKQFKLYTSDIINYDWRSLWFSITKIKEYKYLDMLSPDLKYILDGDNDNNISFQYRYDSNIVSFILDTGMENIYNTIKESGIIDEESSSLIDNWIYQKKLSGEYYLLPINTIFDRFVWKSKDISNKEIKTLF